MAVRGVEKMVFGIEHAAANQSGRVGVRLRRHAVVQHRTASGEDDYERKHEWKDDHGGEIGLIPFFLGALAMKRRIGDHLAKGSGLED